MCSHTPPHTCTNSNNIFTLCCLPPKKRDSLNAEHSSLTIHHYRQEKVLRKAWSKEYYYEHYHPTSPAMLCHHEASVVTLLVFWTVSIAGNLKKGQHHLRSIIVRPSSIAENQCPLILNVQYPSTIPCPGEVPVHVCITNRLASR